MCVSSCVCFLLLLKCEHTLLSFRRGPEIWTSSHIPVVCSSVKRCASVSCWTGGSLYSTGSRPLSKALCFTSDPDVSSLVPLSFLSIWAAGRRLQQLFQERIYRPSEDFVPVMGFQERDESDAKTISGLLFKSIFIKNYRSTFSFMKIFLSFSGSLGLLVSQTSQYEDIATHLIDQAIDQSIYQKTTYNSLFKIIQIIVSCRFGMIWIFSVTIQPSCLIWTREHIWESVLKGIWKPGKNIVFNKNQAFP